MEANDSKNAPQSISFLDRVIRFFLENKIVAFLMIILILAWGVMVAPFDWDTGFIPRDPVPVDAIPDIGENQQIVFTQWMGRSPQDVEDQVSYPLTIALLGIPDVKTIRSYSMFGFSTVYVIFREKAEHTRIKNADPRGSCTPARPSRHAAPARGTPWAAPPAAAGRPPPRSDRECTGAPV